MRRLTLQKARNVISHITPLQLANSYCGLVGTVRSNHKPKISLNLRHARPRRVAPTAHQSHLVLLAKRTAQLDAADVGHAL